MFRANDSSIGYLLRIKIDLFKECDNNMYGMNCSMSCGNCLDGEQCHHINGSCLNGCDPGWQAGMCVDGKLLLYVYIFYLYLLN